MPEQESSELLMEFSKEMRVRSLVLGFSAKRTIRVGEEFRTFEAHETWTLDHPSGYPLSIPQAQHTSAYFAPKIVAKVLFGLYAGGVISQEGMREGIKEATRLYGLITEPKIDPRENSGDIPGSGEPKSTSESSPNDGINVSSGPDGGMPTSTGSGEQLPSPSESGNVSSSPSSS